MEATDADQQKQQAPNLFAEYASHERWTREQLMEYQARALRACRDYAYAHSPFYQRFHQGLMDRPLQELPVLTKTMMMEHFDELVTDRSLRLHEVRQHLAGGDTHRLYADRYLATATSGSTGQPAIFLSDPSEFAIEGSTFVRVQAWGGMKLTNKVALMTALTAPPSNALKEGQTLPLVLYAMLPMKTIVQGLNDYQPEVLVGHGSICSALANEQRQGRLHIAPHKVFCSGDTLTSDMRQRIVDTWQAEIFNAYGTTEGNALAGECTSHQGLHLFEDYSIVEIVDENNQPLPPGASSGKVLLTVLFRRTQPLIRYELSDVVHLSSIERCPCGRPFALIEAIEGRMVEVLYLPSPSGNLERISPYLFFQVAKKLPIGGWQLIVEKDGLHFSLLDAAAELRDEEVLAEARAVLAEQGVIVPPIEIHRVNALIQTSRGKTPMVISRVAP